MRADGREVDVAELERRLQEGGDLVDVREPDEYVAGHAPDARLVPMGELTARLGELDKDAPVFVICRSGHRSDVVVDFLVAQGYDAWNVAGGTLAWAGSGRPLERGAPGA